MNQSIARPALMLLALMTVALGLAYPLAVTGIATIVFPERAHGSLLFLQGRLVGSSLIGQHFSDPKYFWGRPSATTPQPNNGVASSGSNLGPLNPALLESVRANVKALRDADPDNTRAVPVDLVTASASGLDPEISIAGAQYQALRVARLRHLAPKAVLDLVAEHAHAALGGFLGEPRVNVLELNLALDALSSRATQPEGRG